MSTRRKGTPRKFAASDMFTLAEVLVASPVDPMPAWDREKRKADADTHLIQLALADKPSILDWRVVAMCGNVVQVLLQQGAVQDEDGLLEEALQALREAATRTVQAGANIRLSGPGLSAVRSLVGQWGKLLDVLPHRTVLQAFREVHRRLVLMDAGQRQPGDFLAQIDGVKT